MPRTNFSSEGSPSVHAGPEEKILTKSWRDMTEDDWEALKEHGIEAIQTEITPNEPKSWRDMTEDDWEQHKAQIRADRGLTSEAADRVMGDASTAAQRLEAPETRDVDDDGLTIA